MEKLGVVFGVPDQVASGLNDGTYERVGGVIRDSHTKNVVAWLREVSPGSEVAMITQVGSAFNPVGSLLNTVGSVASVLNLGCSMLNLAVSVTGFETVIKHLNHIEKKLDEIKKEFDKHHKELVGLIDLGFYANFNAALNLANSAFTMNNIENRRACAMQAINRFLEAEEHYTAYVDKQLERKSRAAEEYLLSLSLAYIAEARCYLELEELPTARRRLQEAAIRLQPRFQKYVELLLTTNPAAYLHPVLKDEIDLKRLTQVYQWLKPGVDENTVLQEQRDNFFSLERKSEQWKDVQADIIWNYIEWKGIPGTFKELTKLMVKIEAMIETHRRFDAYQLEIKAIEQQGISFHDWLKLTTSTEEEAQLLQQSS